MLLNNSAWGEPILKAIVLSGWTVQPDSIMRSPHACTRWVEDDCQHTTSLESICDTVVFYIAGTQQPSALRGQVDTLGMEVKHTANS